ncbi:MAG TPA: flagellar basal body rod protein FlgC [Syntrophales bacterium]|nr:flagellar basal body rod protein FlgC [Syntrophobacterales bacterium]HRR40766.1 flagellar basal body rod protein FlgC [Syntrophales bacterium]HRT27962.1 flagellar basal body rod protein FlgC [Syntrophales bacterium]HRT69909.1 flagellar basal body rod protein FlgC [Syntrophales bacterium]
MDFFVPFRICGSGLTAQRAKMDVITANLANVDTTRTPEGGPYMRKVVSFSSKPVGRVFDMKLRKALNMVSVGDVEESKEGVRRVADPGHPDADASGFVSLPNVNVVSEMAGMIMASRAYEACVTAFDATKSMALKTLEIGR